ncbi:outer membrane beta-barrel protein, partial [bacterium]|nr:outer membrane beta-barrel protein [bacterium]
KEGDLINQIGPGVTFTLGENRINTLTFSYNYLHRFYTDHSEVSSGDHVTGLSAAVTRGKVRMTTSHSLSYLTGIQGANSLIVEQDSRLLLSDQLRVNLDLTPKSDVYLSGTYSQTDQAESSRFADSSTWSMAGGYGFKYSEGLRFFSQLSYGKQKTSGQGRVERLWDFMGGSVGAEGEFTKKLTGTLQFGYQRRSSDFTGISAGSPTITAELEQLLGDRMMLALSYTRANQVNVDAFDSASVSDNFRLTLRRALGNRRKWFASVFGGYYKNDFSSSGGSAQDRSDTSISFGGGVDYQIQEWLSSSLTYSFSDFSADIPSSPLSSIDYQVNQVNLLANFGF